MISKLQRLMNRARVDDSDGFTLIELLIVVVIIGILAAIAIPQFSSTKEKAYDSTARSDLRNLTTAQEGHFANWQSYASTIVGQDQAASSTELPFNISSGMDGQVQIDNADNRGFVASAQHPSSDQCFAIRVGEPGGSGGSGDGEVKLVSGGNVTGSGCPIN